MVFLAFFLKKTERAGGDNLGGETFLEKCRLNMFKQQVRGLNMFGDVSVRFSEHFSRVFRRIFVSN